MDSKWLTRSPEPDIILRNIKAMKKKSTQCMIKREGMDGVNSCEGIVEATLEL